MRTLFYLCAALIGLAACSDGHMKGDDPNRNKEGPGEGQPMDSSPSQRERLPETTPDKQRPYADDKSTEQTTTAPPDPEPK
jgi:hypothetical protein